MMRIVFLYVLAALFIGSLEAKSSKKSRHEPQQPQSCLTTSNRRRLKNHQTNGGSNSAATPAPAPSLLDFESGFYIAYVGPESKFNTSNLGAITYLQNAVRETYNGQIGCDAGLEATVVELTNQTMSTIIDSGNRRLATNKYGFTFSLLNFYKVTGKCRTCSSNPLLVNDAGRRKLAAGVLRRLQTSGGGVAGFNSEIVVSLVQRAEFADITNASISSGKPPNVEDDESEDFLLDLAFLETVVTSPSNTP